MAQIKFSAGSLPQPILLPIYQTEITRRTCQTTSALRSNGSSRGGWKLCHS